MKCPNCGSGRIEVGEVIIRCLKCTYKTIDKNEYNPFDEEVRAKELADRKESK